MSIEVLKQLADKLGVKSASVVKKAEEYYRRCSAKSTLGLSNFSDTAKSCAILHIACQELSAPIDKALATRLSCLTKPAYLKLLNTLKALLDGGSTLTVAALCSSLGVSEITQPANEMFKKYEQHAPPGTMDAIHPMYACAAVLATCKRLKVKTDTTLLKENCRVKWSDVQKIAGRMSEIAKNLSESRKRRNVTADPSTIATEIEMKSAKLEEDRANERQTNGQNESEEDEYEAWKKKILEQAS